MRITVTAISKFQKYFPGRTTEIDFPGGTLAEFLDWIRDAYGLDVNSYRNIKITHNSVMTKEFAIPLNDGDRVSFIPIVAGG